MFVIAAETIDAAIRHFARLENLYNDLLADSQTLAVTPERMWRAREVEFRELQQQHKHAQSRNAALVRCQCFLFLLQLSSLFSTISRWPLRCFAASCNNTSARARYLFLLSAVVLDVQHCLFCSWRRRRTRPSFVSRRVRCRCITIFVFLNCFVDCHSLIAVCTGRDRCIESDNQATTQSVVGEYSSLLRSV